MAMTEAELMVWIGSNWPSLLLVLALGKAYLKIRAFPLRLRRVEKRIERIMTVCAKQHGDQAAFLFREEEDEE